ncbi:MAG: succinate--CoA ligase [ADP-forming] subunit beta [Gammaproteobacteria bacterium]|jgi:succinyl-CoA synthetase beta subunit|nr:MAG: succinate--CoA ligase [ADP-forming] subunit beta [Gammaproteobacteria bacterium]|tara:strand:+ start:285 stop:1451 length:1167 start_codon:yes stop_codon:yes gene_type:complete
MNLHEYQSKELFREYEIPVSIGKAVDSAEEAEAAAKSIGGDRWVVKAQVHAGGRGKAGGVKLIDSPEEAYEFANQWLGKNLVTYQTDENGQPVSKILVETCTDIENELYLGAVIDRESQRLVFMASEEGGVNIEEVAEKTPEKIFKTPIDPIKGANQEQAIYLAENLNLSQSQTEEFVDLFLKLSKLFLDKDLSLLEINPLVINADKNLICLDAKINIDSNALYRQEELHQINDESQEDTREVEASKWDLNYVALDGNIGCMVNGAGLAMGTMDIIKLYGGDPANFLDVGGTVDAKRVSEAFKIILSDENVKAVLINIFGGIVRCDVIADGVIEAVSQMEINVPVVVRLEGNQAELGTKKLGESGLNIIGANSLEEAASKVVEVSKGS